jgi:hypothetical protein
MISTKFFTTPYQLLHMDCTSEPRVELEQLGDLTTLHELLGQLFSRIGRER